MALGSWPVSVELPVQWGEMDDFGHVNNAVFLRWFESARIAYFQHLWPEHVGTLGKYGRMGLPQLQQLAAQSQGDDAPADPEQVEAWAHCLVDAERKCFLAVAVHRSVRRLLLINLGV